ncbi:unnamed protein product [Penicillium discolor]
MSSLTYLYICCGCGDGPKVYNHQPICVPCNHQACGNCENFTGDPDLFEPLGICLDQAPSITPEVFVGRQRELDEIAEHFDKNTHFVLGGMHGVGKTQVARAYAEWRYKSYSSVLWLNAASEGTLNNSLQSIVNLFDPRCRQGIEDNGVIECVDRWLSHWKNEGWLLIFDGYDRPSDFDITRYYPSRCKGNIIITTCRPDLVAESTLLIKPFHHIEDSLAILQTRSKRENVQSDPYAERLAKRLAGLPLALVTAGMYLRRSVISFEKYLEEYDKRWNSESHSYTQPQEYGERTIQTTLDLSYAQLEGSNFGEDPKGCPSYISNPSSSQGVQSTAPQTNTPASPAIDVLVSIFMEDRQLAPLYQEGLFGSCTTPSRFVRELKRLLKRFAARLREESTQAVGIGIANFVSSRAGLLAARIRSQCEHQCSQIGPASTQQQGMEVQSEFHAHLNKDSNDTSDDDEDENEPERAVAKYDATIVLQGRKFIEGSTAFRKLQVELTDLVKLSKLDQGTNTEPSVEVPLWAERCINFISFISFKKLRVELKREPVGWTVSLSLETSVPENHQRFRWMTFGYGGHGLIDVRCHPEPCERGQSCACIPPVDRVFPQGDDYMCQPIPSKLSPPFGPRLMMELFKDPDSRKPHADFILRQLPKKVDTELDLNEVEMMEAWGIFYREDWDWTRIWVVLGLAFFPPSLLFGVLWGIMRQDIQGAFGVASWWMASATIAVGIVGTCT